MLGLCFLYFFVVSLTIDGLKNLIFSIACCFLFKVYEKENQCSYILNLKCSAKMIDNEFFFSQPIAMKLFS